MKKTALVICCLLLALGCAQKKEPASDASRLQAAHPRLLMTAEKTAALRNELGSTRKFLWKRFLEDLPRAVDISTGRTPVEDVRLEGDLAPQLAFAWLMTGEDSLLRIARQHVLHLTDPKAWEAPGDLVYLIGGHFLLGIALAYDWLYPRLDEKERAQIAECLGKQAQAQYESIVNGRIWWRNQYYQNHSQSNYCGLAFAAAALYGENPRAGQWLEVCKKFFDKIFEVMPEDGSSVEGYAYAGYGAEYILKYVLLAQEILGKDFTGSPWMKNYASYMIQGLLPERTSKEWAMTFGDAPRRGWTSQVQHLFTLASLYKDPAAQWMGRSMVELYPHGLGNQGWMIILEYDPAVPSADPKTFPAFSYFPSTGQVMMRSAWEDNTATLVGFKCSPFMGRKYFAQAPFDWGTGHRDPDDGSFQLFSHGQFLTIDPGYTGFHLTANHNTMLFKGHGQLGEQAAFGSSEARYFGHCPDIVHAESTPDWDYAVGEVAKAYPPALGVSRFTRHMLFVRPDILLVADQVSVADSGAVYDYPPEALTVDGEFSHADNGYVIGKQGSAWTLFDGIPGRYRIEAVYLDNVPGVGKYSLEVDGKTVYRWISRNEDRDDNLIEVSPEVALKKSSRVAFRGEGMPEGTRLTKMALLGMGVKNRASAEWLLHFDPQAVPERVSGQVRVSLGGAVLDLYPLAPRSAASDWATWKVKNAEVEPFTYRTTTRLVIKPKLDKGKTTLLNLMHTRAADSSALCEVSGTVAAGDKVTVSWIREGKARKLTWDLEDRTVKLE